MKHVLFLLCTLLTVSLSAQDEFSGSFIRPLDESSYETITITETADCYDGQFGEVGVNMNTQVNTVIECFMDGVSYFFLVMSWDEFEFEISPLQWDNLGQVASFELLAEFEMEEPLIFYRDYQ
jgi:hypothetical protein